MKLCGCGCGGYTEKAIKTQTSRGEFKGRYRPYIMYHRPKKLFFETWKKMDPKRERKWFINKITKKQGIGRNAVYQRVYNGWTRQQIIDGYRIKSGCCEYVEGLRPYDQSEYCDAFPDSDIIDNAQIRLGFLLFDTIKSLTNLDDIECYTLTAQINVGLRDRLQQ